ncbi:hypothetical protein [Nocardia arthritidis]|uniref:Uncharacterized protein n=1 Tax=Nocardia arthritidis TaxID=228602 RepID=A0A6G9Y7J9_9NOCA|nr:hypothetical protein [Nocardia arthritidis]QIS09192.1 hypothetical protein F5544_06405 [Nocardia arthritidis]
MNVTDNSDITYALGHFSIAVGSDVTVAKSDDTNGLTAKIWYTVYIYDFYYYHLSSDGSWDIERAFKTGVDGDMRQLEEAGWARSFRVRGDGTPDGGGYWSGAL